MNAAGLPGLSDAQLGSVAGDGLAAAMQPNQTSVVSASGLGDNLAEGSPNRAQDSIDNRSG